MAFTFPSVADFKAYFFRDFAYDPAVAPPYDLTKIQDLDITKAMEEAKRNFNSALFGTQEEYTMCFLYLTAHYMVMDLRASSQGIAGSYAWLTTGKSVGSVSESFGIPQKILDNPLLAMYSKTNYGAKYLSLVLPYITGPMFTVCGGTSP